MSAIPLFVYERLLSSESGHSAKSIELVLSAKADIGCLFSEVVCLRLQPLFVTVFIQTAVHQTH